MTGKSDFLLISDLEILDLKHRLRIYPFNQIFAQLKLNCQAIKELGLENIVLKPPSNSLFVIYNILQELGLAYKLADDLEAGNLAKNIINKITAHPLKYPNVFAEEIHTAFILTGIIIFEDLYGELFAKKERDWIKHFVTVTAKKLWNQSFKQPWGQRRDNRWNHTIIGFSGVAIAAISLRNSLPEAQQWLETATQRIEGFFVEGITDNGMTREGLWYCSFVFKILGLFLKISRRQNFKLGPYFLEDKYGYKLDRLIEWYLYEAFPQGKYLNNLNDSYWDPHPALWGYLSLGSLRNPNLVAHVWEILVGYQGLATYGRDPNLEYSSLFDACLFFPHPVASIFPENPGLPLRRFCPDVGYLNVRDVWSSDATVVTFNCGEYLGGIHDQSDNNSFTLIWQGQPLIIDSGAANNPDENSASSSLGHNLVLIDRLGQRFAGRGHGVSGKIIDLDYDRIFDCIAGDATSAYNLLDYNPVRFAIRQLLFVRHPFPYLITFDDIEKGDGEHLYEYILHVPLFWQVENIEANKYRFSCVIEGKERSVILFLFSPNPVNLTIKEFHTASKEPFQRHQLLRFGTIAVNPKFVALFISEKNLENLNLRTNFEEDKVLIGLSGSDKQDLLEFRYYDLNLKSDKLFEFKRFFQTRESVEKPGFSNNTFAKKNKYHS
jgi:hypothetical protein